ncbi:MAG: hypothetical protein QG623_377 [Patescibacteria group bacterium]|nr:hypothetical protein [Patescibacteria group bacterium]
MSTKAERRPISPRVKEFTEFVNPPIIPFPELEIGTLYGGVSYNLGRVGVYLGINESDKSPYYMGYKIGTSGAYLQTEVDLRTGEFGKPIREVTFSKNTFFQPLIKLGLSPRGLSDQALLAWLAEQDLLYVQSQQQRLIGKGQKFADLDVYHYEMDQLDEAVAVIRNSQSLIHSQT